jgi:hypothetical protein
MSSRAAPPTRAPVRILPPEHHSGAGGRRAPSKLDGSHIASMVLLAVNVCALVAFVLVCIYYYDSFRLYVNTANDIVSYAVQQGSAVVTKFGADVGNDAVNLKNKFLQNVGDFILNPTATPVQLESCEPGWHNDGWTCRKPIHCTTHGWSVHCTGGQVRGRLNHGGCCKCGKFKFAGLCWKNCPNGYSPLMWPLSQVCVGQETSNSNISEETDALPSLKCLIGIKGSCPKPPPNDPTS